MKIYFASSIKGVLTSDKEINDNDIILHLNGYGVVFAGHLLDNEYNIRAETNLSDEDIHNRDMNWLLNSDVLIADVSYPSLGVGYEIGRALENHIPILCLYHGDEKKLSSMIRGCAEIQVKDYVNTEDANKHIDVFLKGIKK